MVRSRAWARVKPWVEARCGMMWLSKSLLEHWFQMFVVPGFRLTMAASMNGVLLSTRIYCRFLPDLCPGRVDEMNVVVGEVVEEVNFIQDSPVRVGISAGPPPGPVSVWQSAPGRGPSCSVPACCRVPGPPPTQLDSELHRRSVWVVSDGV